MLRRQCAMPAANPSLALIGYANRRRLKANSVPIIAACESCGDFPAENRAAAPNLARLQARPVVEAMSGRRDLAPRSGSLARFTGKNYQQLRGREAVTDARENEDLSRWCRVIAARRKTATARRPNRATIRLAASTTSGD